MEKQTVEMTWTNWRGKKETRTVKQTLDIRDFKGRAGFALLVIAANPHLSGTNILTYLSLCGVGRTASWVNRRRWLFHDEAGQGQKANADGKDSAAQAIMSENPTLTLRDLSRLLAENGIVRGKDWVRRNRVSVALSPIHKDKDKE